jgi:hypothetical protein
MMTETMRDNGMGNYEQETGMRGARGENDDDDKMAQMTFIFSFFVHI